MVTLCLTYWGDCVLFFDSLLEASTQAMSFQNVLLAFSMGAGKPWQLALVGSVGMPPGSQRQPAGHPETSRCLLPQAVQWWVLLDKDPSCKAARTSWFCRGRFSFDCLECCVSLDKNHRVRGEKKNKTKNVLMRIVQFPVHHSLKNYKLWNPTFSIPISGTCFILSTEWQHPRKKSHAPILLVIKGAGTDPTPSFFE